MLVKKNLAPMASLNGKGKVSSLSPAAKPTGNEFFDNWITKKLLASHLGMSVSFINKYMKLGLPFRRRGRSVRYRVFEVEEWLQRRFT